MKTEWTTIIISPPFSAEPHPYKEEDTASEGTDVTLPRECETWDFHFGDFEGI